MPRMQSALWLFPLIVGGVAQAQVATDEVCRPSHVLYVHPAIESLRSLKVTMNGKAVLNVPNVARAYRPSEQSYSKQDVGRFVQPGQNKVVLEWQTGKVGAYDSSWVRLTGGVNGSYSTVLNVVPEQYRNVRRLSFTFQADTSQAACEAYGRPARYQLTLGGSTQGDRLVEWSVDVNGRYVLLSNNGPSMMNEGRRMDLTRFLRQGKNTVTLHWRLLSAQSTNASAVGAQITRVDGGQKGVLLNMLLDHRSGLSGSKSVTITVK